MILKKITFCIIILLNINSVVAQKKHEKLTEFKALNGVTYRVGDKIKLNSGSTEIGDYEYIYIEDKVELRIHENLSQDFKELEVTIKQIEKFNFKLYKGVYFKVIGPGIRKELTLDIQNAILTCEVNNCIEH